MIEPTKWALACEGNGPLTGCHPLRELNKLRIDGSGFAGIQLGCFFDNIRVLAFAEILPTLEHRFEIFGYAVEDLFNGMRMIDGCPEERSAHQTACELPS